MRAVGRMSGLVVLGVVGSVGVALAGGGFGQHGGGHGPQGGGHPGPGNHPGNGHDAHNHGGHGHGQGHGHFCPGGHAGAGGKGGQGGQGGQGGTGGGAPAPCVGSPPPSALITDFSDAVAGDPIFFGTPPQISGGTFSYAAPALTPPVLTLATGANGTPALAVASNPGLPTDPANGFFGFGLFFDSCVDASAYNAVKFTINGDLGDCAIRFAVTSSENVSPADDPRGTCTEAGCFPPSTQLTSTGTIVVPFFGFTFPGSPNVVDPTSLIGIQWQMDTLGIACHASFSIDDISFVTAAPPSALSATFDKDAQGWGLNTFVDTQFTNLAATPPPGVIPPRFGFTPSAGDPSPGSLALGVTYSDFNQYADVIVNPFPPIDLAGKTVHARVRLVSGPFARGGFQLHVSTGSTFVFAGNFFPGSLLTPGVWVPIDFDLTTVTDPAFDASQVVQVGVQFFSGAPDGAPFPAGGGMTTFEIDTVVSD